ncbi:MAG TPA: hypothetical protein VGE66_04425 [Chitinophagaceae bacterium]
MDNLMDIEVKLWEYIDGMVEPSEKSAVEKLIAENAEWKAKYHELLEVHQSINLVDLEEPSLRFTRNVMDEIAKYHIAPATREYINKKIIWGIAAFFITVIVSFVVYGLAQIDWSAGSSDGTIGGVDFRQVDYSRMFSNTFVNIFMMLNILLGLMLLDRYLADRRTKYLKEA